MCSFLRGGLRYLRASSRSAASSLAAFSLVLGCAYALAPRLRPHDWFLVNDSVHVDVRREVAGSGGGSPARVGGVEASGDEFAWGCHHDMELMKSAIMAQSAFDGCPSEWIINI
ncbi:MAG: hypothetical protein NXI31_22455 [bacterium]|nr:hypothetical protein [bacterium]